LAARSAARHENPPARVTVTLKSLQVVSRTTGADPAAAVPAP